MENLPTIAVIGPGKVGAAVGILAAQRGYTVTAIGGRRKEKVAAAAWRIGPEVQACTIGQAAGAADLILLSISDDAIEKVTERLARKKAFTPGSIVVHLSGALSSELLASARQHCRCAVASMHPLQTFPTIDAAVDTIQGAYCFYEGDDRALPVLKHLATTIGLKPYRIDKNAKTLYHASAVMACNYFIALMDAALTLAEQAGIEREVAWPALEVLMRTAHKNISALGTQKALTGPIARGDIDTVKRHLQSFSPDHQTLNTLYRALGQYTTELAAQTGSIPPEKAQLMMELLTQHLFEHALDTK